MEDAEWNDARCSLCSFTVVNEQKEQKSEETDTLLYYNTSSIKQPPKCFRLKMCVVHSVVHS